MNAEVWVHAQSTGRNSVVRVAMQSVTKRIRHIWRADAPDHVLVALDIDRADLALAAALCGDPQFLQDLNSDPYLALARQVYGAEEATARRAQCKSLLLGLLYGKGVASTARELGWTEAQVGDLTAQMRTRWPQLFEMLDQTKEAAKRGQPRFTIGGRPSTHLEPREAYVAISHRIQGSAADLFNAGRLRVADAVGQVLYGGNRREGARHLWLGVHDEIIVSVPATHAQEVGRAMEAAMNVVVNGSRIGGTATVLGKKWLKQD